MGQTLAETRSMWAVSAALVLVALLIRVVYILTLEIQDPIRADGQSYFLLAFNLLNFGVYSTGSTLPLSPSTFITPGYPLFLASIMTMSDSFESFVTNTMAVQVVVSSLSCGLVFLIAQQFLSAKMSALCSAFLAISPHSIILTGNVLTETLFVFLSLLAVFLLSKSEETGRTVLYVVAGVVFSLAVLVRPGLMIFPFVAALIILWQSRGKDLGWDKPRKLAFLLVSFMVVLGPWVLWANANKADTEGSPIAAQIALGSYPNLVHKQESLRGIPYREDPEYEYMAKSVGAAVDIVSDRFADEPLKYSYWYLIGKPVMFHQASVIVGQGGAFLFPVQKSLYDKSTVAALIYGLMMRLHPLLVIIAAITSIWLLYGVGRGRTDPKLIAISLSAAVFVYFTAVHTVLAPLPRYSIPLHPFVYILAVAGIAEASRRLGDLK